MNLNLSRHALFGMILIGLASNEAFAFKINLKKIKIPCGQPPIHAFHSSTETLEGYRSLGKQLKDLQAVVDWQLERIEEEKMRRWSGEGANESSIDPGFNQSWPEVSSAWAAIFLSFSHLAKVAEDISAPMTCGKLSRRPTASELKIMASSLGEQLDQINEVIERALPLASDFALVETGSRFQSAKENILKVSSYVETRIVILELREQNGLRPRLKPTEDPPGLERFTD